MTPRFVVVGERDARARGDARVERDARPLTLDDVDARARSLRVRVDADAARCRVSARIARAARGADAVSVVERAIGRRNVARCAPVGDGEAWCVDVEPDEGESLSACAEAIADAARAIATSDDGDRATWATHDYFGECDNGF